METRFYTAHKSTMTIRNNDPFCGKLICKQASDPRDGAARCEYEPVRDGVADCTVVEEAKNWRLTGDKESSKEGSETLHL